MKNDDFKGQEAWESVGEVWESRLASCETSGDGLEVSL